MSKLSFDTNKHDEAITSKQQEPPGSSRKGRVSRWDLQPKIDGQGSESDGRSKRRKTRWSDDSPLKMSGPIHLPAFAKLVGADLDPEIQELQKKLLKIEKRILEVEVNGDTSMGRNSPSSPVYDDFGITMDSGDANFHEKLIHVRQNIIGRLIEKNPTFKAPSDKKPPKLRKRLYIPVRQYPDYNFIGLIIGPRGNTQRRMEKETGAKIMLRGKGSRMDGKLQHKPGRHDDEDLHVLIEAENAKSLDHAVEMVEKILVPVVDGLNEHKRAQLRELAILNGNVCNCGQVKHMRYACPSLNSVSPCDISCSTCGGSTHSTVNCPLTVSTPSDDLVNQQKRCFLADIGGAGGFTFSTPQISSNNPWQGGNTGFSYSPAYGSNFHFGTGSAPTTDGMSSKEVGNINLAVGHLPQIVDDALLRELFAPFGRVIDAKVIKDGITGSSKGFGFVEYDSLSNVMKAVVRMNGYKIDGKTLTVKVAENPYFHFGAGSTPTPDGMCSKEIDFINLAVRHLPQTVDDVHLRELFAPFGRLIEAYVIKCGFTGSSRGFGFVKYDNPSNAMAAVLRMNGYKIDGKAITVKVAETPSAAVVPSISSQPWNWAPAMASQDNINPASWPGPPGSMLADSQFSSPKSHNFGLPHSSFFLGYSDTSSEQFPSSDRVPLSSPSLLQFPGNLNYHKSQHTSYFSPPSKFSPQMHPNPSLSDSILPSPWPPIQPPRSGTFDFP